MSEPNERPEDFDEWLNAGADAFGGETAYMRYIRRLEADNAWRRTTLTNRDKTVSRMSKEIASVKTERDEARINLRALEASAATKPADGPFRTGGQVTLNVYEGDRPIFQAHTPEDAERLVSLLNAGANAPETAAELERLRQERAQMGLRIFVAEKELKKIALNHAEPARSGVVAAIGALNGDFPNGTKGTDLEMDRLRETNRDQATILADLREWMSVAGMAVEKDVDMLFVLKGRFDTLETNRELVELLELLDRMGGLGLDKHEWIRKAIARAKVSE